MINELNRIITLIESDQIETTIICLKKITQEPEILNELILLSARHNKLLKDFRMNIINYEKCEVQKNKIRIALIQIVSSLGKNELNNKPIEREQDLNRQINIIRSKNVNVGNIHTNGGDFLIGDNI